MENNSIEKNALTPIPKEERLSWVSLVFVQAGICVCVPSFLEGALLAEAMPVKDAILSGTLGYVIVVVVMSILGFMGSDLGMATCTLTESTFGKKGARYLVSTIFALNLIGWFGINNAQCGEAFSKFIDVSYGIHLPVAISNIFWGIIMLLTAVYGMKAMEKLDIISIPLLMIVMSVGTYLAIKNFGLNKIYSEVEQSMSFWEGVGLSFDFYAVGVITAADITRFQKSRRDTVLSTVIGVFPMGVITLLLGILLTKIANDYDIGSVLITVGIPIFGIISLVLSTWTTNSANAYSSGLNLVMTFNAPDNRRREITIFAGIIGIILGIMGILDRIEEVLNFLAYLVCPIGGVMLADYFCIGKGKAENWKSKEGWNIIGILTWGISIILSMYLQNDYVGILIAMGVYLILYKIIPEKYRVLGGI
ncbi:cytosine permease [Fusobacterium polymorphum]|uniref:cytosine permease n=1 Tax=Fusobacterium nucleatum subsp. polymorphum TaxID=76857 RepID=UPI00300820CB